jgi:threonyl-tRNA synthetase
MAESNQDRLLALRHTAEHILTQAMLELYPGILPAMGPATDDGFYFDFDPTPKKSKQTYKIGSDDFEAIEKKMAEIIKQDLPLRKEVLTVDKARELFKNNPYKQEWLDEIEAKGEKPQVYWTGKEFVDLCSGPHVKSTGLVKAFKLLSVAGAYWRGSETNKMLTRIYGTAFDKQEKLNDFLERREQIKKRDHKRLGKELDLFIFSDLVGSGLPLFTPKGTQLRNLLSDRLLKIQSRFGYQQVTIPHITKKELYEKSGHWEKFADELFKIKSREGDLFALKPMNCPHHIQIYASRPRSYRDLPQRYAETTMVYRDEQSGELSGLSRVRMITQDDAHIFLRTSQIKQEVLNLWDIVDEFYAAFNFKLNVSFSRRDPAQKDQYLGGDETWEKAESILRQIIRERVGENFIDRPGEAAFYGPKIDFIATDAFNREWQLATIQLDFNLPERFRLTCINEKGEREDIVMIHRAIMGAIERFLAILIEHTGGAFPVWLAPEQVRLIPIADRHLDYAHQIESQLDKTGFRVSVDGSSGTMAAKIRTAQKAKIPYMLIVGDREAKNQTVSVRLRSGENLQEKTIAETKRIILDAIENESQV